MAAARDKPILQNDRQAARVRAGAQLAHPQHGRLLMAVKGHLALVSRQIHVDMLDKLHWSISARAYPALRMRPDTRCEFERSA
jgi:hypothetical protein